MKKLSNMGSSKYEFDPLQLDRDIQNNQERYEEKMKFVESKLNKILLHDPIRQNETWEMVIEILRNYKK